MTSLRDVIAEALNSAHEDPGEEFESLRKSYRHDGHRFNGACYVCRGDVGVLADRIPGRVGLQPLATADPDRQVGGDRLLLPGGHFHPKWEHPGWGSRGPLSALGCKPRADA